MIFSVKDASFAYKDKNIFSNMNFSVESGDILAVLGPNGSGKTTLLRCLMGFLELNKGKASINEKNIKYMRYSEFWSNVSYVPQAKGLTADYTVLDMVILGCSGKLKLFGSPGVVEKRKAIEVIEKLNLLDIKDKKCSAISGGELQMVLIARALVSSPKILILDEPESNLDFKNQFLILDLISRLAKENIICVFNTHYPAHALRYANKSLMLSKNGKYVFGDTKNIITEKNIEKAFEVKTIIEDIKVTGKTIKNIIPVLEK